jgi:hypothetical protein
VRGGAQNRQSLRPLPILRITLVINIVVTLAAMTLAYCALRAGIRTIRQSENEVLSARIQQVDQADRRVNWLLIVMTGLATALLTMLIATLVFVTRPGAWRA